MSYGSRDHSFLDSKTPGVLALAMRTQPTPAVPLQSGDLGSQSKTPLVSSMDP